MKNVLSWAVIGDDEPPRQKLLHWVLASAIKPDRDAIDQTLLACLRGESSGGDPGWSIEREEKPDEVLEFRIWAHPSFCGLELKESVYSAGDVLIAAGESLSALQAQRPELSSKVAAALRHLKADELVIRGHDLSGGGPITDVNAGNELDQKDSDDHVSGAGPAQISDERQSVARTLALMAFAVSIFPWMYTGKNSSPAIHCVLIGSVMAIGAYCLARNGSRTRIVAVIAGLLSAPFWLLVAAFFGGLINIGHI